MMSLLFLTNSLQAGQNCLDLEKGGFRSLNRLGKAECSDGMICDVPYLLTFRGCSKTSNDIVCQGRFVPGGSIAVRVSIECNNFEGKLKMNVPDHYKNLCPNCSGYFNSTKETFVLDGHWYKRIP